MKATLRTIAFTFASIILPWSLLGQQQGVKVSIMIHEDGSKTVTKNDPEQHTSEEITYSLQEKVLKRIIFSLDENNVAQSALVYNAKDKPERKLVFKYDPLSRLSEEQDFSIDGRLLLRFVYEYGKSGKVNKIRVFDANGVEQTPNSMSPAGQH